MFIRAIPVALCAALLLASPALAVLYRWVDDDGLIHVVDEHDKVPEEYLDRVTEIPGGTRPTWGLTALVVYAGLLVIPVWVIRRKRRRKQMEEETSSQDSRSEQHRPVQPPPPRLPNEWEILGVSPSMTTDEIRKAYRQRMHEYHPDRVATLGYELRCLADAKSKRINEAYQIILKIRGKT